jgi:hypothetical protein
MGKSGRFDDRFRSRQAAGGAQSGRRRRIGDRRRAGYGLFFGLASTNAIGNSVLLMSPFLTYLAKVSLWDPNNKLIVLDVVVVLFMVLALRSTGFEQIGYRFSLDFLPFVFWLLMRSQVQLTKPFKWLIFLATAIDVLPTVIYLASGVDRRQHN